MINILINEIKNNTKNFSVRKIILENDSSLFGYKKHSNMNIVFTCHKWLYNYRYFFNERIINRNRFNSLMNCLKEN